MRLVRPCRTTAALWRAGWRARHRALAGLGRRWRSGWRAGRRWRPTDAACRGGVAGRPLASVGGRRSLL